MKGRRFVSLFLSLIAWIAPIYPMALFMSWLTGLGGVDLAGIVFYLLAIIWVLMASNIENLVYGMVRRVGLFTRSHSGGVFAL